MKQKIDFYENGQNTCQRQISYNKTTMACYKVLPERQKSNRLSVDMDWNT